MALLSASEILARIDSAEIVVSPFSRVLIRPASLILHLGDSLLTFKATDEPVDPYSEASVAANLHERVQLTDWAMPSGTFVISSTTECISLAPSIMGMVANLSHLARLGLDIHQGATLIHPGIGRNQPVTIVLEITNHNPAPVKLSAGMPICHLYFFELQGTQLQTYDTLAGVYSMPQNPELSRYWREFTK